MRTTAQQQNHDFTLHCATPSTVVQHKLSISSVTVRHGSGLETLLLETEVLGGVLSVWLSTSAFRKWQQEILREVLSSPRLRRGYVPVKPFIFSDGEVLGEHAQACYYCVNLR
ncbi:hypothetical protein NQZ68_037137 [Dissostichus eleginoides]|nr:hypothetical protein NQZ68_037137 [Dissostichus eleginoides]